MLSVRIAWLCIGLLWIAAEIRLARNSAKHPGQAIDSDKGSRKWLWLSVITGVGLALSFKTLALAPIRIEYGFRQWLALAFFLLGLGLRFWAVHTLGEFFSTHVLIQHQHQLIMHGPYRWIRHPTYSGLLIALAGAGLAMGDMLALLLIILLPFIAFTERISNEETAMIQAFGHEYRVYRETTYKLFPGIY